MQIKPLTSDQSGSERLFDRYIIENLSSFDELMEVYQEYRQQHAGKTILLTLDDLGQAEYTSVHSIMFNDLDETAGYDLSGIDPACFEEGEHIGYLSTPSEFFIRKENFLKKTVDVDFLAVCDRGLTIDENEVSGVVKIMRSPIAYLDKQIILNVVPVEKPYEGIFGFPNGYFQSDLDPFENFALAKYLYEKYELMLFGIGASLLGFIRNDKWEAQQARELIHDLSQLYNTEESVLEQLLEPIQNSHYVFLKYIEHLEQ
jgi:hypothetical protein